MATLTLAAEITTTVAVETLMTGDNNNNNSPMTVEDLLSAEEPFVVATAITFDKMVLATNVFNPLSKTQEEPTNGNKIVEAVTVAFLTVSAMTRLSAFSAL